jgi:hypothetical protein
MSWEENTEERKIFLSFFWERCRELYLKERDHGEG